MSEFADDIRARNVSRREVIETYVDGSPNTEVFLKRQVRKREILRFTIRCLVTDQTGEIYGFYALLPSFRLQPYAKPRFSKDVAVKKANL
jgi:hypothetical protein